MFRKCFLMLTLSVLLCSAIAAQDNKHAGDDENSGIIYGADHAFVLTAPDGWVLDNASGVSQGLHAVFYPKGSSWKASSVVMYANVVHKKSEKDALETIVESDVADFKRQSPGMKVEDAEAPSGSGKNVLVKYFVDDNSHEAVAYIGESKVIVMLVLNARTKKGFDDALPAFRQLISSYHFLGDKVIAK
jgi:hypothetical protein